MIRMKAKKATLTLVPLFLFFLAAPGLFAAGPAPIDNLARYLAGTYIGVTPGNNVTINIVPVTFNLSHPYDYFVTVFGKFGKVNYRSQGVIRVEPQGDSIYVGYLPHFNPAISSMSPGVGRFSSEELNSACGEYLKVEGDGFSGVTRYSDCARAIRGTAGRSWQVDIEPNRLMFKDVKTGETLRFEKKG